MGEQHVKLTINDDNLVTSVGHDMGGSYEYTTIRDNDQFDNCVLCGKTTTYKTSTHIDMRFGYVEGVGQLCSTCYSDGSPASREMIMIPKNLVEKFPNNMQLGEAVRKYFWENYK
jgi:hypothetical protein